MADIEISPLVETWEIANLTIWPLTLSDVPGLNANPLPPLDVDGNPVWIDALDFTDADILAASDTFRNALITPPLSIATRGYKHTHQGLYDADANGDLVPDASTWHSHSGMDILTGGVASDADSLHTHGSFITSSEVDTAISTAIGDIDLSVYVLKDGSINQLVDITSDGATIESAILLAHAQDHSLLDHIDDVDPFTIANFRKLLDGSNADCCHVHSSGSGTFDGEHNDLDGLNEGDYWHLTAAQYTNFGTLTDGSNADALHTHTIGEVIGDHNELDGLQGGSFSINPSLLEYYHLDYYEFNLLTNGNIADSLHTHDHNLLSGIQGGDPSNDDVYHASAFQIDILSRLDEDSAGLTFDGEPIGSGICEYGTVYVNDIQPTGAGNVGDKIYLSGSNDEVLISCSADDLNIRVYVIAMIGPSNLRPSVTVNGTAVGDWGNVAYETDNRVLFRGYADFLLVGETVTATHEDGATDSCTVTVDTPPVISSVTFTGAYPGSQIEYKAVDDVDMTVTADIDFDQVEVENSGACDYQLVTSFGETTTHAWTAEIADRGDVRVSRAARVRVRKPSGTWSAWVYTSDAGSVDHVNEVYLNNLYPSVGTMNQGSITYPGAQEAIKGTETVSIVCVCSDYDTITYSDPTGNELTIPNTSTYQSPKLSVAGRTSGNYNISSTNYRVSCNRTDNDATTTKNLVVYIADLALTVTMSEASRLRTGGNDGTAAQNYTITMTCNQNVLSTATPTIAAASANGGTWSGSFSGGPSTYTRTLIVDESDSDTVGTYSYNALSVFNLANTETTSYTGDSQYIIGGFVTRDITLAAFQNESTFNAAVVTYTKCSLTWSFKSLPTRDSFNSTTAPQAGAWCFAGTLNVSPTTARILDTAATAASSNATTLTVEETI